MHSTAIKNDLKKKSEPAYIFDAVIKMINDSCKDLCKILNHPMLQTGNLSNGVAGTVDRTIHNKPDNPINKPKFIFEHATGSGSGHSKHLLIYLQTYLAPLSNVQFAATKRRCCFSEEN